MGGSAAGGWAGDSAKSLAALVYPPPAPPLKGGESQRAAPVT